MSDFNQQKEAVAKAALAYVDDHRIIGIGTGSTVNYFIRELAQIRHRLDACVSSSEQSTRLLRELNLPVVELTTVDELPVYVDGADEVNSQYQMIKGGGGALTREKILAAVAREFICLVDQSKVVKTLGEFPLALEVLPLARSYVAREIVKLGGDPMYREGFITDNGNIILDIFNLNFDKPQALEDRLNTIPGVVENGLFANRPANVVLVAKGANVTTL